MRGEEPREGAHHQVRASAFYTVYKGDEIICTGSARECAEALGVKVETIYFFASQAWKRHVERLESCTKGGFKVAERI